MFGKFCRIYFNDCGQPWANFIIVAYSELNTLVATLVAIKLHLYHNGKNTIKKDINAVLKKIGFNSFLAEIIQINVIMVEINNIAKIVIDGIESINNCFANTSSGMLHKVVLFMFMLQYNQRQQLNEYHVSIAF